MSANPTYEGGIDYTCPTITQRMQIDTWRQRQLNAKRLEKAARDLREDSDEGEANHGG